MNKTIIVVLIAICTVAAICLGVAIVLTPEPVAPPPENPYKDNGMFEILEIDRAQEGWQY